MTNQELHDLIIEKFCALPEVQQSMDDVIEAKVVHDIMDIEYPDTTKFEGIPSRAEHKVQAVFRGTKGQAFTETPREFTGTLREIVERPFDGKCIDSVLIASINAVMGHFGLCRGLCHCGRDMHEACGIRYKGYVANIHKTVNVVIVGYQAFLMRSIGSLDGHLWTMDRNYDNITKYRNGSVITNSGRENRDSAKKWADLIIITGSSLCNGTIVQWLDAGDKLLFYGVTIAGVAKLLDLKRLCFASDKDKQIRE